MTTQIRVTCVQGQSGSQWLTVQKLAVKQRDDKCKTGQNDLTESVLKLSKSLLQNVVRPSYLYNAGKVAVLVIESMRSIAAATAYVAQRLKWAVKMGQPMTKLVKGGSSEWTDGSGWLEASAD
ncbi:hypothetical protein HUJ05_009379 [Dendroctonus ponderosae]|nr:hypothetical protein HUJ05_009379 [Dendroctonus ponderosae]